MKLRNGRVSLALKDGSLFKRALLCRTGVFDGMNGEVDVTEETLNGILERYQKEKSKPQNENDFAPILLNHDRLVENVMGRILADGMEIAPWSSGGESELGLYANLRIDDENAKRLVESGKYSQLSISYDEDTSELFEVSFVAVPAAKGSIILSRGDKMNKKQIALARLDKNKKSAQKLAKELGQSLEKGLSSLKKAQLKAKFQEFVKEGRLLPVELKAIDFKAMSHLDESALKMVVHAYAQRPVSDDVHMFGQASEGPTKDLRPAAMREAIALQRSGKAVKLGMDEVTEAPAMVMPEMTADKSFSLGESDYADTISCMNEMKAKLEQCLDMIKALAIDPSELEDEMPALADEDDSESLADDDKKEDEKKLADDSDDKKEELEASDDKKETEEEGVK